MSGSWDGKTSTASLTTVLCLGCRRPGKQGEGLVNCSEQSLDRMDPDRSAHTFHDLLKLCVERRSMGGERSGRWAVSGGGVVGAGGVQDEGAEGEDSSRLVRARVKLGAKRVW